MKNQTVSQLFEKYEKLFYQSDDWKERGKTKEEKKYLICAVCNLLNDLLYVHQYGEKAQQQKDHEVQKLKEWTSSIKGVNHLAQKIATELENATFQKINPPQFTKKSQECRFCGGFSDIK